MPKRNTLQPFQTVTLVMDDAGEYRQITSVHDAAETLLKHWPVDDGEWYLTAVQACLDALKGRISPELAREALIKAADEAGISLTQ